MAALPLLQERMEFTPLFESEEPPGISPNPYSERDYMEMKARQRKVSIMPGEAGEDGDFVQLRKVREQRRASRESQYSERSASVITPEIIKEEPRNDVTARPSTAHKDDVIRKMRKEMFDAVTSGNQDQVTSVAASIKKFAPLTYSAACDPDTGQNVLHFAISTNCRDMAVYIISNADQSLLLSHFNVQQSGIHGKCNALHQVTEKNDIELARFLLDKIKGQDQKLEAIKLETAVDIQGQRPRLFSCLLLAAFYGHHDLVRLFLGHGIPVNHPNGKNDTALLWAARWGHNDTVTLLLDSGADPEIKNDKGSTALYWAVRYEHVKTVALLLQKGGANPNTTRKLGLVAPIVVAAAYGNNDITKLLATHPDIDVNITIRGGEKPIHHAAREGCLDVLETLVKHNATLDARDELGDTPLMLAAQNGHVHIVNKLIEYGSDVNCRNHEGYDTWFYAIDNDTNHLLEALVTSPRRLEASGRPPLCIAASTGRCDKIEFLLKMRLDPLSSDLDGNTFLHYAAMNDQHEVIEKFHGRIPVDTKNKRGNTPLHTACFKGFERSVMTLIKSKAKADVKNGKGETPLHVAAYSKYIKASTVRELVAYTIKTHSWESLNAKDFHGNNALHVAGKFAKPEVMWEFRFVRFKDRDEDGLTPLHEAVRPDMPESLDMMLDIFETMKRDARINEQTYAHSETVLHLAADEGLITCVKRLIDLGADVSLTDNDGNSVLHRLTEATVDDPQNMERHLAVVEVILENIVKWWCIKKNMPLPEEDNRELFIELKRQAILSVTNDVYNKEGLSVLSLAFKIGAPEMLERLLMLPNVTLFYNEDQEKHNFDITHVTPRTSNSLRGCCGNSKVSPTVGLSGLEWLITQVDKSRAAPILDLPPMLLVEKYYTSMVAWSFAVLMIVHILYMSIFTYVGVDLLAKLRDDPDQINAQDPETLLLYIIVPLEPAIIIVFVFFTTVRYFFTSDFSKRSRLSRKRGWAMAPEIIASYSFMCFCVVFAALVFAWIGLFTQRYTYQDYVLAAALVIGWLLSIALTRGFRLIHYFYRMLLSMILRDIVRFVIVYLFVLLGFGFALHVLIQVSPQASADFDTPGDTLFLAFNMMIGMEYLFEDTFIANMEAVNRNVTYLKAIYILYMLLGTIVLLNLLIAMMNDSYSNILREQQITWRIESVSLGVDIENAIPWASKVFANVQFHFGMLGPKSSETSDLDRWYVSMPDADYRVYSRGKEKRDSDKNDALSKRLERLETKTAAMETQTQTQLQQITEMLRDLKG